jgi:fatty-acyl-CoA synthase
MATSQLAGADPLAYWARLDPERPAVADPAADARLSYGALDAAAAAWSRWLRDRGIVHGDRVAVLAGTRWELFALLYACMRTGAVLVPLNWRLADRELADVLAHARPALTLVDARFVARAAGLDLDSAAADAAAGAVSAAAGERGDSDRPSAAAGDDAPVLMLFTSGSAGAPKGALLSRRQLFFNAVATCFAWELGSSDCAPISTPLFHTGGWNVLATPLLHCGGRIVLADRFEPAAFMAMLADEGCTIALTVPTQLVMLQETADWGRPLPALRRFISGGAPLPATTAARTRAAGYRLREGYGLTECGPNCFMIGEAEALSLPGAVGRPVPFLDARIVDDRGSDVHPGLAGELWLRGPQLFSGYFDAPALTAQAVTPDGWLRTGDLARRGAGGEYYICGRIREMFISGGENVFPAEVEAAIGSMPGVIEVAVVGIPDPRWGEVGTAFVVARSDGPDAAALSAHARAQLAGYKVPRTILMVAELPRLGSGKVDRITLGRLAASGGAS